MGCGMHILKLSFIAFIFHGFNCLAAISEPIKPELNVSEMESLIKKSAYASFLGDVCSITNEISENIKKISTINGVPQKKGQEILGEFKDYKAFYTKDSNTIEVLYKCYVDGGKNKILVINANDEVNDYFYDKNKIFESYNSEYAQWQHYLQQEEDAHKRELEAQENARNEKIKDAVTNMANQLGGYIISREYQGGDNITVRLVSYNSVGDTFHLNVDMYWSGSLSGETGYEAEGEITAINDDSDKWVYGKNVTWTPTYHSSKLKEWIQERSLLNGLGNLLTK